MTVRVLGCVTPHLQCLIRVLLGDSPRCRVGDPREPWRSSAAKWLGSQSGHAPNQRHPLRLVRGELLLGNSKFTFCRAAVHLAEITPIVRPKPHDNRRLPVVVVEDYSVADCGRRRKLPRVCVATALVVWIPTRRRVMERAVCDADYSYIALRGHVSAVLSASMMHSARIFVAEDSDAHAPARNAHRSFSGTSSGPLRDHEGTPEHRTHQLLCFAASPVRLHSVESHTSTAGCCRESRPSAGAPLPPIEPSEQPTRAPNSGMTRQRRDGR